MDCILALHLAAQGLIFGVPKKFSLNVGDLLIALLRTVDRGLIISIESI